MIHICLNDHQMNGESVPVIEVWTTPNREDNTKVLACSIPFEKGEKVVVAGDTLTVMAGENGEAVVVLNG